MTSSGFSPADRRLPATRSTRPCGRTIVICAHLRAAGRRSVDGQLVGSADVLSQPLDASPYLTRSFFPSHGYGRCIEVCPTRETGEIVLAMTEPRRSCAGLAPPPRRRYARGARFHRCRRARAVRCQTTCTQGANRLRQSEHKALSFASDLDRVVAGTHVAAQDLNL